MASTTEEGHDPFRPERTDTAVELAALARALTFAEGFKLLFARCDSEALRRRLDAELLGQLGTLPLKTVLLEGPIVHLLDELQARVGGADPSAVQVLGLEQSLPSTTAALVQGAPVLANLNAARSLFPQVLRAPLLLWLPEYAISAIARQAPDFFSIRSGLYYFDAPQEAARSRTPGRESDWVSDKFDDLSLAQKEERIATLQGLLSEVSEQSTTAASRASRAYLLGQLGALFLDLGRFTEAQAALEDQLRLQEALGDQAGLASAYEQRGDLEVGRGELSQAATWFTQAAKLRADSGNQADLARSRRLLGQLALLRGEPEQTEAHLYQALAIYEALAYRSGAAASYVALGRIAMSRGDLDKAAALYRRALDISISIGARERMAMCYLQLAVCAQIAGRLEEAESLSCSALEVVEEEEDPTVVAMVFFSLGGIALIRGNLSESEAWCRKALAINERLGQPFSLATTYGQLSFLTAAQNRPAEAMSWAVRSLKQLGSGQRALAPAKDQRESAATGGPGEAPRPEAKRAAETYRPARGRAPGWTGEVIYDLLCAQKGSARMIRHLSSSAVTDEILGVLDEDGAVILDALIEGELLDRARLEVEALMQRAPFGNAFGGTRTQRAGAIVAAAPSCRALIMHEQVLRVAGAYLSPWTKKLLLHLTQGIFLHPGQEAQIIHRDRVGFGPHLPRAVEPQLNLIWALSAFTADNGATRVVLGSHRWEAARRERADEVTVAAMTAGSALIYSGSVLHGGGENRADACRLGLNIGYCLSWLRQEENQYLSCPPAIARELDPALQALLGYTLSETGLGSYATPDGLLGRPERALGRPAAVESRNLYEYVRSTRG